MRKAETRSVSAEAGQAAQPPQVMRKAETRSVSAEAGQAAQPPQVMRGYRAACA
jgi:hypothetical protein